ncbi:MAG: hypothetical protein WCS18_04670, partial [Sphaerochaetaceae bacterium]
MSIEAFFGCKSRLHPSEKALSKHDRRLASREGGSSFLFCSHEFSDDAFLLFRNRFIAIFLGRDAVVFLEASAKILRVRDPYRTAYFIA